MLVVFLTATPSNCGESLKGSLPNQCSKEAGGQVNSLGYGKNVSHATMGNPQPSPYSLLVWGRFRDLMGVGSWVVYYYLQKRDIPQEAQGKWVDLSPNGPIIRK